MWTRSSACTLRRHHRDRHDRLSRRALPGRRWTSCASPCRAGTTHGSAPWSGVDPIVAAAQIVLGLQTIVSRQINVTQEPAVVTIGGIDGGNRFNIIPDKVEMVGTVRTFDEKMRDDIHSRIKLTVESIAAASQARPPRCPSTNLTTSRSTIRRSRSACCRRCNAWPARRTSKLRAKITGVGRFLLFRPTGPGTVHLPWRDRRRAPT